ncbi:FlgD immunoglobulin-like domain containing protein [Saccharospirillum impatiens]|uniref:FlgD immunoglobulin-like domain containing protein n=1 Tax=Saccharospirillum impatiens TaxID=169438 RepID=UPI00048A5FE8|nr:FlgD immunoglobulin-like domain containing protein [Saccharospirillum impatiens]
MNGYLNRVRFIGRSGSFFTRWLTTPVVLLLLLQIPSAQAFWWWHPAFDITIETTTNGQDADQPPGPELLLDDTVTWTYTVTNTGNATLQQVDVFDHTPDPDTWFGRAVHVCLIDNLKQGNSQSCTRTGVAQKGQYENTGIALAQGNRWWQRARDADPSHYLGTLGNPAIELEKSTEGQDADVAPGPELTVGEPVEWIFTVRNTGDVDLTNLVITDELVLPSPAEATPVCEIPTLTVGESRNCRMTGVAVEGQYKNLGRVTARGLGDSTAVDDDASHYLGVADALAALPTANPTEGSAPLAVTFIPDANTQTAIVRYEWDFDGDGTYDRSETVGRNQTFTYQTPGGYDATLRVTDSDGEQATSQIRITVGNQPPEVSVDLNPSNGPIPLTVTFNATATDVDGIDRFEWDFDGDGTYDATTTAGTAAYTYDSEGSFQARLRVTDSLGAATEITVPTLNVSALPAGSPSVTLVASPDTGNPPLNVRLTATAEDPDGDPIDQYEWDLDGDGVYDQTTTEATLNTTVSQIGTFYPRVRITDAEGLQASDTVKIFVTPGVDLSVSTDTLDPLNGESLNVETTLGGETEVSLIIEDEHGQIVRTLVPFTTRAAGDYQDAWGGRDESGEVVSEGEYRAILLYRLDGRTERLDLALTSGGVQSNPSRSSIPSSFSPLAGDPLDITFTLNRASEVTAFMGLFNVNTRLVTFMQRRPLGRGSHTVTWNGENADGQLIEAPPGDRFLFGIFAYTLPDNAIYVRSGVHVASVTAEPSIFQPTQNTPEGPALSHININLNRAGRARLVINDAESGQDVATFEYDNLMAGDNTLTWDGRDNDGHFVAPGTYRLGVTGLDDSGYESITVYALQRVYY